MPHVEFVKGIPTALEQDSYFDMNKRNLIVFDDQMIDASKDKRIVNLFTRGSHHRNLSVIYIVQNLFHQGKVETPSQGPKRKRRRIQFVNYLDDHNAHGKQRKRTRHKKFRVRPYKYSMGEEDD
ncbi:unnamed protein product [Porites lobata]|uniref:Uncharacterized protein n=1 Tax=Porites lobata TaxID=104759 RepID=A0ABN8R8D7_9CNID|nr:unnamed protein product [Porites lobata]